MLNVHQPVRRISMRWQRRCASSSLLSSTLSSNSVRHRTPSGKHLRTFTVSYSYATSASISQYHLRPIISRRSLSHNAIRLRLPSLTKSKTMRSHSRIRVLWCSNQQRWTQAQLWLHRSPKSKIWWVQRKLQCLRIWITISLSQPNRPIMKIRRLKWLSDRD